MIVHMNNVALVRHSASSEKISHRFAQGGRKRAGVEQRSPADDVHR